MPQEQKKPAPKRKSGLLQRIFGAGELSSEALKAIEIAKKENPDLAPVEPYGFLSRLLKSDAQAYASPGKRIYLNPEQLKGQSVQDIADTLAHEQEHIKQTRKAGTNPVTEFLRQVYSGIGTPYHKREDELAAFQVEKDRRNRMGRGGMTATPSFLTGEFKVGRDIKLPPMEKR